MVLVGIVLHIGSTYGARELAGLRSKCRVSLSYVRRPCFHLLRNKNAKCWGSSSVVEGLLIAQLKAPCLIYSARKQTNKKIPAVISFLQCIYF